MGKLRYNEHLLYLQQELRLLSYNNIKDIDSFTRTDEKLYQDLTIDAMFMVKILPEKYEKNRFCRFGECIRSFIKRWMSGRTVCFYTLILLQVTACAPTKDNWYSCTLCLRDSRSVQGHDPGPVWMEWLKTILKFMSLQAKPAINLIFESYFITNQLSIWPSNVVHSK